MRKAFQKRVTESNVTIDNPTSYFVYHQSRAPRKRLPRRVMMQLRQQEAEMIVKTFQAYVIAAMRRAGER